MAKTDTIAQVRRLQSAEASSYERHDAFGQLVMAYQDMACGYAYARLGSWPAAQDAAQEAFIIAYQRIGQLREPAAFGAWLRRIVWSRCTHTRQVHAEDPLSDHVVAVDCEPETSLEASAKHDELMSAVHALPSHERDAILLYYIDGYTQQEVATFLEVAEPALRKRLQRAREHLKEKMITLFQETLEQKRPSRDESFSHAVLLATTLDEASLEAQVSVLEAALVDGIDVNAAGASGQTLLHWAARHGNLDALGLLLGAGADVARLDRLGCTPLQVALDSGQQAAADLLRRWAADHDAHRADRPTAVMP